jgi:succinate dehydrogenase / fumarate reductase cytochrome b subunit
MAALGTLILAFLLLHMGQFWLKAKIIGLADGVTLFDEVKIAFSQEWVVIAYLLGLVALSLHLLHGFQSAFQTLNTHHWSKCWVMHFQFLYRSDLQACLSTSM